MIKKLIYFIIPFIFIFGAYKVNAEEYDMSKWIDISEFTLPNGISPETHNILIWKRSDTLGYRLYATTGDYKKCSIETRNNPNNVFPFVSDIICSRPSTGSFNEPYYDTPNANSKVFNNTKTGNGSAFSSYYIVYSNYSLYDYTHDFGNFNTIPWFDLDSFNSIPDINYSLEPIYKDGYLSSYGIKVNSSVVDDSLYKYQYAIKDNINDNLNWIDLYNNNFLNNEFTYNTKKPIYFYFRILDKSNNDIIDSFTITVNFDLISPEYNIIFNQDKFYTNGTNYIDRVGLSVTYKTSVDGLKYQYQYVNDGTSLSDNNWIETDGDIYQVYNVNGVMYARILDDNNNVLYSSTFTNTLIGTMDILENPNNFPIYNKVQKILNFNNGSISDLVLIPVKVLIFMSESLNNNVCNEYSFGSILGHELKLPCIDIKSYLGNTIYNFYDLVCSFFISLGIIKLLKNIYMRFMTLEIRDIDNKGGIF